MPAVKKFPRYPHNPFMNGLQIQTRKKTVEIKGKGNSYGLVNYDTGEPIGQIFAKFESEEVDRERFVKIFSDGIGELLGLNATGLRIFRIIYSEMLETPNEDKIILYYHNLMSRYNLKIAEATFHRGVNNLIEHGFIACSDVPSVYFVNPKYIFNGDRLQLAKEYVLKDSPAAFERKRLLALEPEQIDIFNQDIEASFSAVSEPNPAEQLALLPNEPSKKICPKCGAELIEKTNRATGEKFLGCPYWNRNDHGN